MMDVYDRVVFVDSSLFLCLLELSCQYLQLSIDIMTKMVFFCKNFP